jgi:hypothetical protein
MASRWNRAGAAAAAVLAAVAIWGCRSIVPRIDPAEPAFSGRSPDELRDLDLGRSGYIAKCSGCHALYAPARGDAAYWESWLGAMASRSKLTPRDRQLIQGYLFAVCSGHPRYPSVAPAPSEALPIHRLSVKRPSVSSAAPW